jgi:hypothetical protein
MVVVVVVVVVVRDAVPMQTATEEARRRRGEVRNCLLSFFNLSSPLLFYSLLFSRVRACG